MAAEFKQSLFRVWHQSPGRLKSESDLGLALKGRRRFCITVQPKQEVVYDPVGRVRVLNFFTSFWCLLSLNKN